MATRSDQESIPGNRPQGKVCLSSPNFKPHARVGHWCILNERAGHDSTKAGLVVPLRNYSTDHRILRYRNMAVSTECPATVMSAQLGGVPAAEAIGQGLAINRKIHG